MALQDYRSQQEHWKNEAKKYEDEISRKLEDVVDRAKKILGFSVLSGVLAFVLYYSLSEKNPDNAQKTVTTKKGLKKGKKKKDDGRYDRLINAAKHELKKTILIFILSTIRNFLTEFLERLDCEEHTNHPEE